MERIILITSLVLVVSGCTNNLQPNDPNITATPQTILAFPAEHKPTWSVYDLDPDHLWNRVFRQLNRRIALDGTEYGSVELDPLLWFDTTYLLHGSSHPQAREVLDEFLETHAEDLIRSPLKRAIFQRDLWAVFDWLAFQAEPFPSERQALKMRLAQIIRRVALSKEEIVSLPDNYASEIKARTYAAHLPADQPEMAFLPADLFQPDSAWVPMGREGGPVAMTHTEAFPFFGRSVFLVLVRSPHGRTETLDFIQSLKSDPNPVLAIGSDVALVRRMLLIDDRGELILSPLIETIQIRHFAPAQHFHEYELNRPRLFEGFAGGLDLNSALFMLFMSHGDAFERDHGPGLQATIPEICKACHFEYPPIPSSGNTRSLISYSRQPFALPDNTKPILLPTTLEVEAQTVIEWKMNHETWESLQALWSQSSP